jgi:hypothetical protein
MEYYHSGLSYGRWAVEAVTIQEFRQYADYLQPRAKHVMMEVSPPPPLTSWRFSSCFETDWRIAGHHVSGPFLAHKQSEQCYLVT